MRHPANHDRIRRILSRPGLPRGRFVVARFAGVVACLAGALALLALVCLDSASAFQPTVAPAPPAAAGPLPGAGVSRPPTGSCEPPAWRIMPEPGTTQLSDIAAIAPDDVWVVGLRVSMHWDGTAWTNVPIPTAGYAIFLNAIDALGPDDVWAVGDYLTPPEYRTYIIHWHAGQWTLVDTPNPGDYSFLSGVAAVSPDDVWAVGYYSSAAGYRTFTMHWDGAAWTTVPSPSPSPNDNRLYDVAAISSSDAWAVGSYQTDQHSFSIHWDGSSWQLAPPFPLDPTGGIGVDGVASNDLWAAAGRSVVHWNGSQWDLVPSPAPAYSHLVSVRALTANDVWAAGYYIDTSNNVDRTLTMHWNGAAWSVVPSPNSGPDHNTLYGLSAIDSDDVWAVGRYGSNSAPHGLVERYSSNLPCSTPTPTLTATPTNTPTITPTATTPTPTPIFCSGNYTYTVSTSTIVSGTTLVPGSQCRACTVSVTLPFSFTFYGRPYGTANLSSEGNLQFLTTYTTQYTTTCPLPEPRLGPAIAPHWAHDIDSAPFSACEQYIGRPCGIYTSLSGTEPYRIFNIQWCVRFSYTSNHVANFELRLYEGTGRFDFVYGQVDYNGSHATIGVQDGANLFTQYACNTSAITRGTMISWNPPPCPPNSTPTSTPTSTPYTHTPSPDITSTPTSPPCNISFTDVRSTDYFYEPVRYLYCAGVISGYRDNTFRPYANSTRAQLCKIVTLAERWAIVTPNTPTFRDVPPSDPFYPFVETAYSHNVINGYTCGAGCLEFRPGANVTRAQLCKIIVLARGWQLANPPAATFRDVPPGDAFYPYIETAYSRGIISGYACGTGCLEFRPGSPAMRGQISKIEYGAISQP